jgi:hydrogenase maturation factor HypF (carbamoyltransferase family)
MKEKLSGGGSHFDAKNNEYRNVKEKRFPDRTFSCYGRGPVTKGRSSAERAGDMGEQSITDAVKFLKKDAKF